MVLGSSGLHRTASVGRGGIIQVEQHHQRRGKGQQRTRCFIELAHLTIMTREGHMFNFVGNIVIFFAALYSPITRCTLSDFFSVGNIYQTWKLWAENLAHT